MVRSKHGYPSKQGLYSPDLEKEACGVGFVAKINGERSYQVKSKERCSVVMQLVSCAESWLESELNP